MAKRILDEGDIGKLMNLVHNFSNRWNDIGLGLGFNQPELDLIANKPKLHSDAPASLLRELLSQWVQWPTDDHPTKPTLEALCKALRSSLVGLGQLAKKVEREMKASSSASDEKHGRAQSGEPNSSTEGPVPKDGQNGCESPTSKAWKENMCQKIHNESKTIKNKFATLQTTIRNEIIKGNTDHRSLIAHVIGRDVLSEEHETQMTKASTIDEIFFVLPKYWSFLDFSLLENIAENFCSPECEAKKELEQYKHDVQQFCERRISEYPEGSLNNDGIDKVVVILDLDDKSLKHMLNLKEVIADILGEEASKLVLQNVGSGSVVVTYLIATSVGEKLFLESSDTAKPLTQKQKDKLLEANVVSLKFKEITIFSIYRQVLKVSAGGDLSGEECGLQINVGKTDGRQSKARGKGTKVAKAEDVSWKPGDIVWAKVSGFNYWPAKIFAPSSVPKWLSEPPKPDYFLVRFFGSYDMEWVSQRLIQDYEKGLKRKFQSKSRSKLFQKSVKEVQEYIQNGITPEGLIQPVHDPDTLSSSEGERQEEEEEKREEGKTSDTEEEEEGKPSDTEAVASGKDQPPKEKKSKRKKVVRVAKSKQLPRYWTRATGLRKKIIRATKRIKKLERQLDFEDITLQQSASKLSLSQFTQRVQRLERKVKESQSSHQLSTATCLKFLLPIAEDWKIIGVLLEILDSTLKQIEYDYPGQHKECVREMIRQWLRQVDPAPSWENLAEAVEVVHPHIAKRILEYSTIAAYS